MLTEPPFAGMLAFQLAALTVTCWPLCDQVPFQPPWTASPDAGNANVSCHGLMAVPPLLVIVIDALKPPGQLLLTA